MLSEIFYHKFSGPQQCSTCEGEIPQGELVMVWKLTGGKEIYCGTQCWSPELIEIIEINYPEIKVGGA